MTAHVPNNMVLILFLKWFLHSSMRMHSHYDECTNIPGVQEVRLVEMIDRL